MRCIHGSEKDTLEENQKLSLFLNIDQIFIDEPSIERALKHSLSVLCRGLGFSVGHVYFRDVFEEDLLIPSDIWYFEGFKNISPLKTKTMVSTFRYGEDILGDVFSSGNPCFTEDITHNNAFSRAPVCQQIGLKSIAVIPIYNHSELKAIIELFGNTMAEHSISIFYLLEQISKRMSQYLAMQTKMEAYLDEIHKLKFAAGSGQIGVWEYDPKTKRVIWDEQMYSIYGVMAQDFESDYDAWVRMVHPDDRAKATEAFQNALTKNMKFDTNFRIITSNKEIRHIHATAVVKRNPQSRAWHVFGVNIDITAEQELMSELSQKSEELEEANKRLMKLANCDSLTGIPNRRALLNHASKLFAKCEILDQLLAVLYIDIDDFKQINDTLGHPIADMVLVEVANRLKKSVRKSDIIARVGGDEFIEIFMVDRESDITILVEKTMRNLRREMKFKSHTVHMTISIGVAYYPRHSKNYEKLITYADSALRKAKARGKNQFCMFLH